MSFVYDPAGNRSQRTDYNSAITNYSYDALNRLTTINYPDTTSATYGYDVLSRLTTATNPTGTVTIAYDNRSRVSSVTDVFAQVVSYQYDANSNRSQLNLNGTLNASYQYDVLNRLTQLTDNASLNTTFAYDAKNKPTSRTLPNGVVSTYQYDGLDRLTRLTHAKGANTLLNLQYQFNAVNNITQMIDNDGMHNYTYDALDRLTAATHPNQPNESYTYDDVGNRTASHQGSSYSYEPFNRLVSANGTTFGYDTNGNEISKTDSTNSWTYTWDYENRLDQASLAGGITVNYSYDALGHRIQRTSSALGTTKFVYDGPDVLRDLDGNDNASADYLNALGIDNKIRQITSTATAYFLTDHLATTRSFTDGTGSVSSSLAYDSFGNITSGSAPTRYTYTDREADIETGLMYYRARWYDAEIGRFASEDPIGLAGSLNFYSYVDNSVNTSTDPSGLCKDTEYCRKLFLQIIGKTNGFFNNFRPYRDSGFVDRGDKDWSHGGQSGPGKGPGNHYNNLLDRQSGLMRDLEEYIENCIKKGPPPPGLERAFEAVKTNVPYPVNLPTIEELKMEEESNRQMAEFWRKLFLGSVAGGSIYLGGPGAIRVLPSIIPKLWWLIPATP